MIIMLHPFHVLHSFLTLYQSHTVPPTTNGPLLVLLMVFFKSFALHCIISLVLTSWESSDPFMLMIVNESVQECRCRTVAIRCNKFIIACRVNAVTPMMNRSLLDVSLKRCIMYQLMNNAKNSVFPDPWDIHICMSNPVCVCVCMILSLALTGGPQTIWRRFWMICADISFCDGDILKSSRRRKAVARASEDTASSSSNSVSAHALGSVTSC